jgi:hypothetical protein
LLNQTKQVTTNIPDKDWIYGVCNDYDQEGVKEVLIHKENVPDLERKRGPNILAMNKLAAIRSVEFHSLIHITFTYKFKAKVSILYRNKKQPFNLTLHVLTVETSQRLANSNSSERNI